jgi:hypothetical protein
MTTRVVRGTTYPLPPDPVGDNNFYWSFGEIADGKIVVVGLWAEQDAYVAVSEDGGASWEVNAVPSPGAVHLNYLAWNGAVWCLVGGAGSTNYCATSPDAKTWTVRTISSDGVLGNTVRGLTAVASGRFVAFPYSGSYLLVSDNNGVTWNSRTIPALGGVRQLGCAYNGTALCIPVTGNGTYPLGYVQRSLDEGETWDVSAPGAAAPIYTIGATFRTSGGNSAINKHSTDNGSTWISDGAYPGFGFRASAVTNIALRTNNGNDPSSCSVSFNGGANWESSTSLIAANDGSDAIKALLLDESTGAFYLLEDFLLSEVVVEEVPDLLLQPFQGVTLNGETRFHFTIPDGIKMLRVTMLGGRGYADLYLEQGEPASWSAAYSSFDFPNSIIEIANPEPGDYFGWVDSYGFDGSTLTMTVPFWTGFINCEEAA